MSTSTVRLVTGIVLIIHGIGHALAFIPALNIFSTEKWDYHSWLLNSLLNDTASRIVVIILFAIPLIGFIASGLGVFNWLVNKIKFQYSAFRTFTNSVCRYQLWHTRLFVF